MTKEESELKQLAYESERAMYRETNPFRNTQGLNAAAGAERPRMQQACPLPARRTFRHRHRAA